MPDKPVKRASEVRANIEILNDPKTGEMLGYRVRFFPPSHSEEEHLIERELFGKGMAPSGEVTMDCVSRDAVARGKHNFENLKRKRDGKPSIEKEAKAAQEKAEAEAKAEAKAKADAKKKPESTETIQ